MVETKPERRYDLDWLRTAVVLLLVPYHSSRLFDTWEGFYVKNAQTSVALTLIRAVVDPWGMPLLFVIAGAATWLALRRRTLRQYLVERTLRLPVPLLAGLVALVPPQAYVAWLGQGHVGSFWQFYPQYWSMRTGDIMGFSGGFTLAHLWFILFLFVFALLGMPIFALLRTAAGGRFIGWLAARLQRPGMIYLCVLPFWSLEALPSLGGMNPFAFFLYYIAGYVLMSDERFQATLDRSWRWTLGLGGLLLVALVAIAFARVELAEFSWQSTLHDLVRYTATGSLIMGLLGLGHQSLNRPSPVLAYLSGVAYPFYILHQTVIVLLGYYAVRWHTGIPAKFAFVMLASGSVTLGLCELARRWSVTRAALGMKRGV